MKIFCFFFYLACSLILVFLWFVMFFITIIILSYFMLMNVLLFLIWIESILSFFLIILIISYSMQVLADRLSECIRLSAGSNRTLSRSHFSSVHFTSRHFCQTAFHTRGTATSLLRHWRPIGQDTRNTTTLPRSRSQPRYRGSSIIWLFFSVTETAEIHFVIVLNNLYSQRLSTSL